MRTLRYTATALKQLRKIAPRDAARIVSKLEQYAADPAAQANNVKVLSTGLVRLRIGDYRAIFSEDGTVVMVVKVGHRREVYE